MNPFRGNGAYALKKVLGDVVYVVLQLVERLVADLFTKSQLTNQLTKFWATA